MEDRKLVDNSRRVERCPVCSASCVSAVGELNYRTPLAFSTTRVRLSHRPSLWQCSACDSWFTQNVVSEATAMSLYADGMSNLKWESVPFEESKTDDIPTLIRRYVSAGKSVVDIGCNTGELLDFCKRLGAATYGVEPSTSSLAICKEKGHAMFPTLSEAKNRFDVAVAFDVIEHLYDVPGFLYAVRQLLQPGGVLILLSGDNTSLTARRHGRHWWYLLAPEHIVFPSRAFYRQAPGYRLLECITTYASRGYRPNPRQRVRAFLMAIARRGSGLPLVQPDHHLLVLQHTAG